MELNLLAEARHTGYKARGHPFQLSNPFKEQISGLGSFHYDACSDSECRELNV